MHRILLVVLSLVAVSCGGSTPTSSSELPRGEYSATDLLVGTGADAVAGRLVTVNYTLWLYDPARAESKGAQLQSSVGGAPFGFTLGAGQVISGWDRGVPGMKVGGRRRLILPPELAYGAQGRSPIPPNATLVFDIELLAVQ